jgi:hypothetical protein
MGHGDPRINDMSGPANRRLCQPGSLVTRCLYTAYAVNKNWSILGLYFMAEGLYSPCTNSETMKIFGHMVRYIEIFMMNITKKTFVG